MIKRNLAPVLRDCARYFPVVTLTGPRQSGKSTLCREVFPRHPYVSFESADTRAAATSDPRGFLARLPDGAILDEFQHVPDLVSYLQGEVDERPQPGRFILTGSEHLSISMRVSQSLAGRTAVLHLLPLSLDEVRRFSEPPTGLLAILLAGSYPRIHERNVASDRWLAGYLNTLVKRDVRDLLRIGDLEAFGTFLRVCAGRTAQEINLSSLGADCGVSHHTAREWLSVLEACYLVFRVPAWHLNTRKRIVKAMKLHWYDSGLLCHLLGIRDEDHLHSHPLRGAIFESWVASEIAKAHLNHGDEPTMSHLRRTQGLEVGLLVEHGREVIPVECKSGATTNPSFADNLRKFTAEFGGHAYYQLKEPMVVYGGAASFRSAGIHYLSWSDIQTPDWTGRGGRGDRVKEPRGEFAGSTRAGRGRRRAAARPRAAPNGRRKRRRT